MSARTSGAAGGPVPIDHRRRGPSARTPLAALLGLVSVLLLPAAILLSWVSAVGTQTTAFVDTVRPVVNLPSVQQGLAAAVTSEALDRLKLSTRARAAVAPPLRTGVETIVASEEFAQLWAAALTSTHEQLVTTMNQPDGAATKGLVVELRVPLTRLGQQLAARGVRLPADFTPAVRVPVLTPAQVERVRPAWTFATDVGVWLPLGAVVLGVLAVVVAVRRRSATAWLMVGWGLGAALLAALLALARPVVTGALVSASGAGSSTAKPVRAVADALYDVVSSGVGRYVMVVAGLAAVVLLVLLVLRTVRPSHSRG